MNKQGKNEIDLLLAESFKKLAVAHPIEKITIREITDGAGVIRPTFYNHFQDKYELLEWIVRRELIDPMAPLLDNQMLKEALRLALTQLEKEKTFYMKVVRLEGQNSFSQILREAVSEITLERMDKSKIPGRLHYMWLTPQLIADYFAASVCFAVIEWVKTGMEVPINELIDTLLFVAKHSLVELIEDVYRV